MPGYVCNGRWKKSLTELLFSSCSNKPPKRKRCTTSESATFGRYRGTVGGHTSHSALNGYSAIFTHKQTRTRIDIVVGLLLQNFTVRIEYRVTERVRPILIEQM